MTPLELLLIEALSSEWQEEDALIRYVHTHARKPYTGEAIKNALDGLGITQRAEARRFPGYTRSHWRRINARRVA